VGIVTPDELRALAENYKGADLDNDALVRNLAQVCAELGEALGDLEAEGWFASWSEDPRVQSILVALAKLAELEAR